MTTTHTLAPGWTLTHTPEVQCVKLRGPGPGQYTCTGPDAPDHHGRLWYALGLALASAPAAPQVAAAGATGKSPRVDALTAKWEDDGATRGAAYIELRDLARRLEAESAAPQVAAPNGGVIAWMREDGGDVWTNEKKHATENNMGMGGRKMAARYSIPLRAAEAAPQVAAAPADEREAFEAWWAGDNGMSASAAADCFRRIGHGYYRNSIVGRDWGIWQAARAATQVAAAPAMHPRAILAYIVAAMELDNGGPHPYGETEYLEARPYLLELREAGYFADSPHDLDGSFWHAAGAHDEEDTAAFFARSLGAFVGLGPVLKRIFNGSAAAPEVAAGPWSPATEREAATLRMQVQNYEKRIRDLNAQLRAAAPEVAAPADKPITLNGYQLRDALEFLAPDLTDDQLESEVCIQYGPERTAEGETERAGAFCWLSEYPEEGSIRLDDTPEDLFGALNADRAAQAACDTGRAA